MLATNQRKTIIKCPQTCVKKFDKFIMFIEVTCRSVEISEVHQVNKDVCSSLEGTA